MIKKLALMFVHISLTTCLSVGENLKDKAGKISNTCPPQGKRSLKDIFCREPK
jgi:hypothetical protein